MSHDRYPGQLSLPLSFPHRRFRLWSYVPSHSELVVRTEFERDTPHIELLLKSVRQINLPATMNGGLVVDVADHLPGSGEALTFLLSNGDFAGTVIAECLFLRQEQRSRYSPFSLFHGYLRSEFTR